MRKKKILWHSDGAHMPTGFGAYTKYILSYLWKTGKYEIANLSCGTPSNNQDILKFPWKTYPSIDLNRQDWVQRANQDPNFGRAFSYGMPITEFVVKDFQPDIYIGVQDFWAFNENIDKKFWNNISCIAHWTADSLPILDDAVKKSEKLKHHFVWAEFAEKEFKRLSTLESGSKKTSLENVKTIPGCVNEKSYFRLSESQRQELRTKFGIDQDTFVIGTASRNQLRKAFVPQIQAFGTFKKENPSVKAKLIHWTCTDEGWDLEKGCNEHGVDINDVLCAYRCRATGEIFYWPARKGEKDNPNNGAKNSVKSVGLDNFATEEDINNFLNLLDVFMLNISSGGFELFLSQAKLTEIPVIANPYSCFEEQVGLDKGCLTTDETYYYEIGSGFKKATPSPYSIAKNLNKVFKMDKSKRREIGKAGRDFVLKNYSIEVVAKKWEELLDSLPLADYDFNFEEPPKNPNAQIENIPDNELFIRQLYKKILNMDLAAQDEGLDHWVAQIKNGRSRQDILNYFVNVANQENAKLVSAIDPFKQILGDEPPEKRVLITIPESAGDCLYITCLLKDARELYKDYVIYLATKEVYFDIFKPLEGMLIDKVIPFIPEFDNAYALEGAAGNKKIFQIVLNAHFPTQRLISYLHNGEDLTKIDLLYK